MGARQSLRHCVLGRKSNSEAALFMNSEGILEGTCIHVPALVCVH